LEVRVIKSTSYIQNRLLKNYRIFNFPVSAQSIVCEPSRTRIEIETGPNFGGQISVDGTIPNSFPSSESNNGKEFCFLNGNSSSTQTRFIFEIDHKKCDGVKVRSIKFNKSNKIGKSQFQDYYKGIATILCMEMLATQL
jgi:hypothetical protein